MKSANEIWKEKHSCRVLSAKNKFAKTIVQLFVNFVFHKLLFVFHAVNGVKFHWLLHVINTALYSNTVLSYYADSSKM